MSRKTINCESDWYDFHGDTIRYTIEKLESMAKLYGDSAVVSCCEEISFIYSREETDEEYEARTKQERKKLLKRKKLYEKLKREFGESSE